MPPRNLKNDLVVWQHLEEGTPLPEVRFSLPQVVTDPGLTPWQRHVERWKGCRGCGLCETRTNVVLARGSIPADILLCGEAPGASEDVLGSPFMGPAGHLFDHILRKSIPTTLRYCVTNLVSCIPIGEDGEKTKDPDPADVLACEERLNEIVQLVSPRLLVCVGALAEKWIMGPKTKHPLLSWYTGKKLAIIHPAAIIRANTAQQGLMIQRAIVTLRNAVEELLEEPPAR